MKQIENIVRASEIWNALTKIVGAAVHYRHRNVNLKLVWRLASGSVPGALLGLYLLSSLKKSAGLEFVDHLIVRLLGGTLILVAVGIIFKAHIHHWLPVTATRSGAMNPGNHGLGQFRKTAL